MDIKIRKNSFMNINNRLLILILLFLTVAAYGQNKVKFTNISTKEGLPHSDVRAIIEDRHGFMWFGMGLGGLVRFDGYTFKVYTHDPKNPYSLAYNSLCSLYRSRNGTLWVGTMGGGLDRYDEQNDRFIHYQNQPGDTTSLPDNTILSFCEDRNGSLWLGTKGGLSRFDSISGTFRTFKAHPTRPDAIRHNSIRCIFEDPETGMFWIGAGGVFVFDPFKGKVIKSYYSLNENAGGLSYNGVNCIMKDHKGDIWVGTDKGLNKFIPEKESFINYYHDPTKPETLVNERIVRIVEDTTNRLWIATRGGLDLMDRENASFTHFQHDPNNPSSLSDNILLTLYLDKTGLLWIGEMNSGVDRIMAEAKAFDVWQNQLYNPNSLSHNNVNAICMDNGNRLWIGTQNGLNCYDKGQFERFYNNPKNPESLISNAVRALACDTLGELWIGTDDNGLCCFDGKKFKRFDYTPEFLNAKRISSFCADPDGGMWFSVSAVGIYHATKWGSVDTLISSSYSTSMPYLSGYDQNGYLWIGSQEDGIFRLDPKDYTLEKYLVNDKNPGGVANKQFYTVYEGLDGNVWTGSISGLYLFNTVSKKFIRHFTLKDGLSADGVVSIMPDDEGNLWLGTIDGLTRFNPNDTTFRKYDTSDGLPGNNFKPQAVVKTSDGRLYFGTQDGLVSFYPKDLTDNPFPPPVAITEFTLFDKPIETYDKNSPLNRNICLTDQITLRYNQSVFGFRFSALSYIAPEKCRYAYKMEGFDPDWRTTDASRRYVTYTRLPPGNYVFRIKASNNDGLWNETGTSLKVVILPPWWATWLFRSVSIAIILILVYSYYRWRVRNIKQHSYKLKCLVEERTAQLEAANKELESFSYSVSHDLRAPLRGIDGFSQILIEEYQDKLDDQGRNYLGRIRKGAQHMGQLIEDMLKLSKVNRGELTLRKVNLSKIASKIIEELHHSEPERNVETLIQDDINAEADERLMQIVLENLLGNAWKFTSKHSKALIEFGTYIKNEKTIYFVRDDGAGFDNRYDQDIFGAFKRLHDSREFHGTGVGLATVQRIINRHGGVIWADGEVEKGATFYFTLH